MPICLYSISCVCWLISTIDCDMGLITCSPGYKTRSNRPHSCSRPKLCICCWKRGFDLQGQQLQNRHGQQMQHGTQQAPIFDRNTGKQQFYVDIPCSYSFKSNIFSLTGFFHVFSSYQVCSCLLRRFQLVSLISFWWLIYSASKLWMNLILVVCGSCSMDSMSNYIYHSIPHNLIELQLRHMDRQTIESLDFQQHFDQIEIESEHESLKLKAVTFDQAMAKLQERLNEMAESNFYKTITVHFAAKSNQKVSYLEEHYGKREEILRLELQDEKQYLRNIVDAQDALELQIREKEHARNALIIQKKREQVKYPDFIPCLYIQAEKKNSIYGSINQSFDRKGMGNFTAKLGYRSPFRKYDALQLNAEWPISSLRKRYYQLGLEWSNPLKAGTSTFHLRSANQYIFKGIDNEQSSFGCAINRGKDRIQLDISHRRPSIHGDVYKSMQQQFYRPSRKVAIKYQHTFKNDITFQDVTQGQHSQMKAELALPLLGHSNFLKIQYHFRKFFDTFTVRNRLDNQLAKKFFWKSTLQTNFSATAIKEFGRHRYVNDTLDSLDVRGFEPNRNPAPSFANMKASLKFNLHNYPVLQQAKIVSFLYAQLGMSFLKERPLNPYKTASVGLGLSLYAGPVAQIQVLCNAAQYQNQNRRQPVNFQIRFGVFD